MKKFLSVFLALVFALIPLTAFAAELPSETKIMMGDVTGDGKISASDARTVLRISASLEQQGNLSMLAMDADGNGRITASDARTILRVSAKLSSFACGFDGNGTANAVNVLRGDKYLIKLKSDGLDVFEGDSSITIARDGNNFYMGGDFFPDDIAEMLNMMNIAFLIYEGDIYITYSQRNSKTGALEDKAMLLSSMGLDFMELSEDDLTVIFDVISLLMPDGYVAPEKVTVSGKDYIAYSYTAMDQPCRLYVDMAGKPAWIEGNDDNGNMSTLFTIDDVQYDIPAGYVDLSRFSEDDITVL